ncbi:MAG TPA: YbdK family carboxylate-amine ligase [Thermoleophilia bacterium]|nr:YbdK family carboxylate-amine ligase [Thermoleophilia bacterium]
MSDRHATYFDEVEARFEQAFDFDLGLEEEFQVLEPETLALTPGFETLRDAAPPRLRERIAGELLRSEIEVSTPRALHFAQAAQELLLNRAELFALAEAQGFALGATGTHPFSSWKDQEIIDTPHYRLVEERLKYVAWRNNTWAAHVHVGVRGLDRAVAVCDALRAYLPHLLALSANSPFIEDVWTQLHSVRTQTFLRMFPRCGIPDAFGTWAEHRRFYEQLVDTNCIQGFTQIWWGVRPHHRFGTVEVRVCDVQTEAWQSLAISALTAGLIAHLARRYDAGERPVALPTRYVEENLWRAIRNGLDGTLVDWERGAEVSAPDALRALVELAAPHADRLGLTGHLEDVERMLREGNGAQQQVRAHSAGATLCEVYAGTIARARTSAIGPSAAAKEEQA